LVPPQVHGQIAETMALCKFNLTAIWGFGEFLRFGGIIFS
jgi:hypothetical protein